MLEKWAKVILQILVLSGLCASVQANTTFDETNLVPGVIIPSGETAVATPPRVALLLPLRSGVLSAPAEAVRAGFLAASERGEQNLVITVIETGDAVQDVLSAYNSAAARYDLIVGPLSRSAVTALAQAGGIDKPTIALSQPDLPDSGGHPVSQRMLMMGLSIEDEARQIAAWVEQDKAPGKIFAVSTSIAWQRRAANAFVQQARKFGLTVENLELSMPNNVLSASGLAQLAQRVQTEKPALLFVALDAAQTIQLRSAVGSEIPLYGTSQLNPLTARAAAGAIKVAAAMVDASGTYAGTSTAADVRLPELDGVHLVDMPWLLHADDSAVAAYAAPAGDGTRPNVDLDRLYALGIDAFRVAEQIAMQRSGFDIDGVTGQLNVNMGAGATYFQRKEIQAVYQNGVAVPVTSAR